MFFPTARRFAVRTELGPAEAETRLATSIGRPRWWVMLEPERVMGTVSGARIEAYVAGRRNSFRPIMRAQIEPDSTGGSVIRGTIATSRWVNLFTLVWLLGALSLASILVVVSVVGFITGAALMRDGGGRPMPPATALLLSVGAFLLFGAAGLMLPLFGRRLAAGDPDRLLAFVMAATAGRVDPNVTDGRQG